MLNNEWFDNDCYNNRRIYVCKRSKPKNIIESTATASSSSSSTGTVVGIIIGLIAIAAIVVVILILKRKGKLPFFKSTSGNISSGNISYKKQTDS